MIASAADTGIDDPSASTTRAYRENTLMPGPIAGLGHVHRRDVA